MKIRRRRHVVHMVVDTFPRQRTFDSLDGQSMLVIMWSERVYADVPMPPDYRMADEVERARPALFMPPFSSITRLEFGAMAMVS